MSANIVTNIVSYMTDFVQNIVPMRTLIDLRYIAQHYRIGG